MPIPDLAEDQGNNGGDDIGDRLTKDDAGEPEECFHRIENRNVDDALTQQGGGRRVADLAGPLQIGRAHLIDTKERGSHDGAEHHLFSDVCDRCVIDESHDDLSAEQEAKKRQDRANTHSDKAYAKDDLSEAFFVFRAEVVGDGWLDAHADAHDEHGDEHACLACDTAGGNDIISISDGQTVAEGVGEAHEHCPCGHRKAKTKHAQRDLRAEAEVFDCEGEAFLFADGTQEQYEAYHIADDSREGCTAHAPVKTADKERVEGDIGKCARQGSDDSVFGVAVRTNGIAKGASENGQGCAEGENL